MLPKSNNPNATASKLFRDAAIPNPIPLYFFLPIGTVLFGYPTTQWTHVPKATVDKKCQFLAREVEIRTTWQFRLDIEDQLASILPAKDEEDSE